MLLKNHPSPMKMALIEAHKAMETDEVPVGAVIVHEGKIIASAHNQVKSPHNPTGHAEILAIKEACQKLKTTHLMDCDLYVTLEPCPMCAHAISLAKIRTLSFGAYDPKGGGVDHGPKIFDHSTCHHRPEIFGGIEEKACAALLQDFFQKKR